MKTSAARQVTEIQTAGLLRILIVDDSASFGSLAAALLARESWVEVVGVALSGAEALSAVASLNPDVVLMDVQMAPMSGLTAAALIWWMFPRSRVVMMSTENSPRLLAECTAAGAEAFIHKSNFIAEFFTTVGPVARKSVRVRRAPGSGMALVHARAV
jgi:DNA-binding NarL/FixJ family response regulator